MYKKIINLLPTSFLQNLLVATIHCLNKKGSQFITYQNRPKNAIDVKFDTLGFTYKDVAIIIQGPVIEDQNFTLETVKLYAQNFPLVTIIVSTWKNTSADLVTQFKNAGAIVLLNDTPKLEGFLNINYQIVSTLQGLLMAKELNKKYAVKSRSDQRLYNPFFLHAFTLLQQCFIATPSQFELKAKLIVSSMSTLKYRPYGITDMLIMGFTEDLLQYWPNEIDTRVVEMKTNLNVLEYAQLEVTETYLLCQFIKRKQMSVDFTLQQTWQLYNNLFIVLDKANFDIFWYKYSVEKENRLPLYTDHVYKELSFFEWLSLKDVQAFPEENLQRIIPRYTP